MVFLWILLILLLVGALIWLNMDEEKEPERPARQRDKENRPGPRIVRVYRGEEHVTLEGELGSPQEGRVSGPEVLALQGVKPQRGAGVSLR